jgi:hypothetical protein
MTRSSSQVDGKETYQARYALPRTGACSGKSRDVSNVVAGRDEQIRVEIEQS